jgi:hypothetical protein
MKGTENGNRLPEVLLSPFIDQNNLCFFLCSRICLHTNLRLKINFNNGTTIPEQSFTNKARDTIQSNRFRWPQWLHSFANIIISKGCNRSMVTFWKRGLHDPRRGDIIDGLDVLRKCVSNFIGFRYVNTADPKLSRTDPILPKFR